MEHPFAAMDIRDRHPGGGRFKQKLFPPVLQEAILTEVTHRCQRSVHLSRFMNHILIIPYVNHHHSHHWSLLWTERASSSGAASSIIRSRPVISCSRSQSFPFTSHPKKPKFVKRKTFVSSTRSSIDTSLWTRSLVFEIFSRVNSSFMPFTQDHFFSITATLSN